jgi:transcriptional regulator with XRE-family HTH domain
MEITNEKLRQQFSERLKKELTRLGLPVGSPTQIASEFNSRYPGKRVAAQTVRKWLLAEAIPTQAKLLALAEWLEVSPQWLRFGSGRRIDKAGRHAPGELDSSAGVIVVGQQQAALGPIVDMLTHLSSANVRLVEKIVRVVLAEQEGHSI